jgi:3-methylcrotonyl-CoA carboxylase alpha subunit
VDSGFRADDDVTHFYDPMLAKLIVHAEDRTTAIQKMQAALREFIAHGVVTNIDFLQDVLSHPDFANGKVSTRWVETNFNWTQPTEPSFETLITASLADLTIANRKSQIVNEFDPYSPWKNPNGFRN